jgi:hypothetical protein
MNIKDRYLSLSRPEVTILGGVIGYAIGLLAGPVLRVGLTGIVMVGFWFLFKHIDAHLESNLGLIGVLFAVFFCNIVGSVEGLVGGFLGNLIADASRWGLAAAGALAAPRLQQVLADNDELDEYQ